MTERRPLQVKTTAIYRRWLAGLRDRRAVERITGRVRRVSTGLLGDARPVGQGVSELRIDYGPGYRLYFTAHGDVLIVLLCGGDKSSQSRDIELAQQLAKDWEFRDDA